LRGEVGRGALGRKDQESTVLNDKFEAGDPLRSAPTDPTIAILECITGGPPGQKGYRLGVDLDDLTEEIADRRRGTKTVERIQLGIEPRLLLLGRG
jgi:hypothetical protein